MPGRFSPKASPVLKYIAVVHVFIVDLMRVIFLSNYPPAPRVVVFLFKARPSGSCPAIHSFVSVCVLSVIAVLQLASKCVEFKNRFYNCSNHTPSTFVSIANKNDFKNKKPLQSSGDEDFLASILLIFTYNYTLFTVIYYLNGS